MSGLLTIVIVCCVIAGVMAVCLVWSMSEGERPLSTDKGHEKDDE